MILHDLSLAFRSIRRNPVLSGLMVLAIGAGIAATIITVTIYHGRAGHPIPWKADKLYAVTMDTRDEEGANAFGGLFGRHPEYPPFQLTWRDAHAIYQSDIPTRSAIMFRSTQVVAPMNPNDKPFRTAVRVTTADFFQMFDVPFRYGSGWSRGDDTGPSPVIVLSKYANDKFFGGANSVGRELTLGERQFRIVGVLDSWTPQPKFYDPNNDSFEIPENIFMPLGWTEVLRLNSSGNTNCVRSNAKVGSFEDLLAADCVWLQFWAELPTREHHERYQRYVDNYTIDQKRFGRFPRKELNNRIVDVDEWLRMFDVVGDESRLQLALSGLFLVVCVLNTFGLMLAKFLRAAPISGLRRALGASRMDIVRQHLIEVVVVGVLGGALGLLMSFVGLRALRVAMYVPSPGQDDNPANEAVRVAMTSIDFPVFMIALALSLLTGLLAGLYPAWRIGRLTPSTFLKTQ